MANRQHCTNCGKYADSAAKFCPECATPFPEGPSGNTSSRIGIGTWLLGIVGLIAVIAAIAVAGGSENERKDDQAQQVAVQLTAVSDAPLVPADAPPPTPVPPPTPIPPPPTPSYRIALVSASCTITSTGHYVECKGFVKNISSQPIRSLRVNIIWYDANKVPQDTHSGFAQYSVLLPGQESPFSTFDTENPALKTFVIQFQEGFGGGPIPYRDDRPPRNQ